ncbi:MAG: M3 family metallopeptidase [Bacteroidales bacterium]|jgi:peptidyl-dipeptidase Dcp|nr:M3 family metallopeptidase [Bacteroidales bacterium]
MKKILVIMCIAAAMLVGCSKKESPNPFFQTWTTPYEIPPFEEIKYEHYLPAFEEGMKQQKAEIDAICNNEEEPTFENTCEALEYSGELLYKVASVFFNLESACNSPEMEEIAKTIAPKLSAHSDDISLNKELFTRIKAIYEKRDELKLDPVEMRLLEEEYKGFVRGGALIPEELQPRFREINEKLSLNAIRFANNVLKASNGYKLVVEDKARLEGMPENALAAALELGNKEEATHGKYVFTIQLPSYEPLLQYCKDRELRKEIWTAYATRCITDSLSNLEVIDETVNLRIERAKMFDFDTHADFVLDNTMAKTPAAAYNLLTQMWKPAIKKAKEEAVAYQKMIDAEEGNFILEPYDWRYYTEKLRKEKYDMNPEEVSAYFSLENVKNGIFMVSEKLFGITFHLNPNLPKYDADNEVFEVKRDDEVIAILYMDYYPRESKGSGAWMTTFREQWYDKENKNIIPIVSLVMNNAKPVNGVSLLSFDQVETFFHEFGHGLHGMLTNCKYRSLSGTNVSRDFVELPSQIMENWASEPEVLKMYAKHYKTGETIPEELIAKLEATGTFNQGFINTELLASSFSDLAFHTLKKNQKINAVEFEKKTLKELGLIPEIISRHQAPYFKHIFTTGYDAGYYSYTWAAVLDADAFEAFKETGDLFDKEIANKFRTFVLEKGNTSDPMDLYVAFRGKKPEIKPLLKNRGLL